MTFTFVHSSHLNSSSLESPRVLERCSLSLTHDSLVLFPVVEFPACSRANARI